MLHTMGSGLTSGFGLCFGREDVPGAMKQAGTWEYLQGVVRKTGVSGVVMKMEPDDKDLTYKLNFPEGKSDWYPEDEVDLIGIPFSVVVLPSQGNRFEVSDLKVGDKLSVLFARVGQQLRVPQSRIVLSAGRKLLERSDMCRCLGILGLSEGIAVQCVVSNFDPALLRIERASDYDMDSQLWTVVALIYGRKGSSVRRLLWADHSMTETNEYLQSERRGSRLAASVSDDGHTLHVTTDNGNTAALPTNKLFAETTQGANASLETQFKAKFGDNANWPCILGRICRKIESDVKNES